MHEIVTNRGDRLVVRRLQPEDAPLLVRLFHGLSPQTRWQRFFRTFEGISALWVRREARRIANIRPERQLALVALWTPPRRHQQIVAGVQLIRTEQNGPEAEMAIVVADGFQRQGVGRQLLQLAFAQGRAEGITRVVATMHGENEGMWRTLVRLGYPLRSQVTQGERSVVVTLV